MYADDVVSMDCDSKPYPEDVWVSGGGHAGSVGEEQHNTVPYSWEVG